MRLRSRTPGHGGPRNTKGFGSVGVRPWLLDQRGATFQTNNALIAGRLIGIKALFSADHGAAAAGLGVTDLGVARFEHFRFGKFRFGLAEQ